MSTSFVPAPIAHLPWNVILILSAIGGFGVLVLYSAAGGSLTPWALNHGVRFVLFLGLAVDDVVHPGAHLSGRRLPRLRGRAAAAVRGGNARRGRAAARSAGSISASSGCSRRS